ncbi:hypothetical protein JTE90_008670 [Oedothorax gibbosus]|uniref:Transposase n=1 Tax=Oedothorax gibbosus TaxID=931172 RepID=A0AAV6U0I3_9ARAC|nr:hypothetical protein JTE90_008670 [Oedothorax gibbosus]
MIWACMSADGAGSIQVIDGILNAKKYIETVLKPKLIPSIRDFFPNNALFIVQQDSAPCHTAKASDSIASTSIISSPYKDLKMAILTTLSPLQSQGTRKALENARRKRKRVQSKGGEVMTAPDVAERLLKEVDRSEKKKKPASNIKFFSNMSASLTSSESGNETAPKKRRRNEEKFRRNVIRTSKVRGVEHIN